jgi:hypothetical protein
MFNAGVNTVVHYRRLHPLKQFRNQGAGVAAFLLLVVEFFDLVVGVVDSRV